MFHADANWGPALVVWTIRCSVAAYFLTLAGAAFPARWRWTRACWTAGCAACWAHVALAMHVAHRWSLAAAYADTARQTREVVGWDFGGGLYFNFLFVAVWAGDAAWWWLDPATRAARPRWLDYAMHAFLALIVLNATVVFEAGMTRAAALAAATVVAIVWCIRLRHPPTSREHG